MPSVAVAAAMAMPTKSAAGWSSMRWRKVRGVGSEDAVDPGAAPAVGTTASRWVPLVHQALTAIGGRTERCAT